MIWLLRQETAIELGRARKAGFPFSAAQLAEFTERQAAETSVNGVPRNLRIAGDVAEIRVEGVLTSKPDLYAYYYGGGNTTYEQIQSALSLCASDPNIKRVSFYIDSPGGLARGLFETIGAIEAFSKPKSVRAAYACSAAYAIAAVAGKIEATSPAAEVGSVGVVSSYYVDENVIDITSTEAPDKRPDPSTAEGQAVIRKYLDAIHEQFAGAIARGRGITVDAVNADYGRGAVLLADDAKDRGMIDKIAKSQLRAVNIDTSPLEASAHQSDAQNSKDPSMNADQFKAAHPELYKAIVAEAHVAGKAEGEASERKRVLAHLKLGKASGATATAEKAIASGVSSMDEEVFSEYQSASMNRRDSSNRQADSNAANAALDGAVVKTETNTGNLVDVFAADLPAPKTK